MWTGPQKLVFLGVSERFSYEKVFVICFISQWMKRSEHALFVFPSKNKPNVEKALFVWPIVLQYYVKAKYRENSRKFSSMKFLHSNDLLTNQKPRAFVSVRYTNQIAHFRSFVASILFARFHFKVIRESLYQIILHEIDHETPKCKGFQVV